MARKSKYSDEVVRAICEAIEATGTDEAGYKAGGISKPTFYVWLETKPDFSIAVKTAKSGFQATCPQTLIKQAKKAFSDYLFGRMEKVSTKIETTSVDDKEIIKETITRVPVGVPQWAIERVLGKPMDVLDALKCLADSGFIPYSVLFIASDNMEKTRGVVYDAFKGLTPELELESKNGMSDELYNELRGKLLGLDSNVAKRRIETEAEVV